MITMRVPIRKNVLALGSHPRYSPKPTYSILQTFSSRIPNLTTNCAIIPASMNYSSGSVLIKGLQRGTNFSTNNCTSRRVFIEAFQRGANGSKIRMLSNASCLQSYTNFSMIKTNVSNLKRNRSFSTFSNLSSLHGHSLTRPVSLYKGQDTSSDAIVQCSTSTLETRKRWLHSGSQLLNTESQPTKWKPGSTPLMKSDSSNFQDIEDKLYDYLSDASGRLTVARFKQALCSTGLRESDPRLMECMKAFNVYQLQCRAEEASLDGFIDRESFKKCVSRNIVLIAKAFRNQFIVPEFPEFTSQIDEIYTRARENITGNVATYIPQLARYSPNYWGVSVCTVDGQRHSIGDVNVPFCLQSVSKPLTYAMVLDELSPDVAHQYVGHEPSGTTFNKISLDYKDKPHNPMINAGAIVTCSLYKQQFSLADRFDEASQVIKRLTGGEYWAFNNAVFLSERETADRNFALGYYMREKKCFPEGTNLMEVLDFYFQLCSVEVTCESGSVIAATLANGGICPITGDKIFSARAVRDTLSLMHSCGMYDYSGQFAFRVGLPSKSGVAGGILLVVPNKMGFFMWSPALDSWGNSVRGVQFCQDLISKFNFHHFDHLKFTAKKIDPCKQKEESRAADIVGLLFSAFNNDVSALKRKALSGTDMDQADYDGRTALHIGAAEGHDSVVKFLIHKCKCNPLLKDRWGFTALDDAKRFNRTTCITILEEYVNSFDTSDKIDRSFQTIDSTTYGEIAFKEYEPYKGDGDHGQGQTSRKGQGDEGEVYNVDDYERRGDVGNGSKDKK